MAKRVLLQTLLICADQRNTEDKRAEDQTETSLASTTQDVLQNQKESDAEKAMADDCSSANQADKTGPDDSSSDGADVPKGRPMSPETLALLCDEQDTMFMATASPNGMGHGGNTSSQVPYGQGMTEVYAEQERIVLSKFRDCLTRLIALGEIKGKLISFLEFMAMSSLKFPDVLKSYMFPPAAATPHQKIIIIIIKNVAVASYELGFVT